MKDMTHYRLEFEDMVSAFFLFLCKDNDYFIVSDSLTIIESGINSYRKNRVIPTEKRDFC